MTDTYDEKNNRFLTNIGNMLEHVNRDSKWNIEFDPFDPYADKSLGITRLIFGTAGAAASMAATSLLAYSSFNSLIMESGLIESASMPVTASLGVLTAIGLGVGVISTGVAGGYASRFMGSLIHDGVGAMFASSIKSIKNALSNVLNWIATSKADYNKELVGKAVNELEGLQEKIKDIPDEHVVVRFTESNQFGVIPRTQFQELKKIMKDSVEIDYSDEGQYVMAVVSFGKVEAMMKDDAIIMDKRKNIDLENDKSFKR